MAARRPLYTARRGSTNKTSFLDRPNNNKHSETELKKMFIQSQKEIKENAQRQHAMNSLEQGSKSKSTANSVVTNNDGMDCDPVETEDQSWQISNKRQRKSSLPNNKVYFEHENKYQSLIEERSNLVDSLVHKEENKKITRPPPINVTEINLRDLISHLSGVEQDKFIIKYLNESELKISSQDHETYNKIKNLLKEKKIKYYTYTPNHLKNKKIVLKGIYGEYSESEIHHTITDLKIEKVSILKISVLNKKVTADRPVSYLITLSNDSDTRKLKNIAKLKNQKVRWENLKKKNLFQCYRCQLPGHAAKNCELEFRCVKCTENHNPGECSKRNKAETPECINCGEKGHPASYRGCGFLKFVKQINKEQKTATNDNRLNKARRISKCVSNNLTYARATMSHLRRYLYKQ